MPPKNKSVELYHSALSVEARDDAENRSKPVFIPYFVHAGIRLRRKINLSFWWKVRLALALLTLYILAVIFNLPMTSDAQSTVLAIPFAIVGSALLFFLAMIFPDDRMYMDRLAFIIPTRALGTINPKVLWSRIEEISIVDVAKSGGKSRFVVRFKEATGDLHDVIVAALTRESLPEFVATVKEYASHARGLVLLDELQRFHDYEHQTLDGISYTQLWESSSGPQFGLTSFTPLAPGTVVQGSLTVVKQIAAGGFSAVYLATDCDDKRFVLKESVIPATLDFDLTIKAQEQFQRESRILAKLNHPRIVTVYDHFVEDNRSYLLMEYIGGDNLRKHISDNGPASEATIIAWVAELAAILEYLHSLTPPVVHRDLSPDNVVVDSDGKLLLIDFGAANEFIGSATGTLVGKHAYMAPEQIRASAEPASDLYSLGACAYFCFTGRDPEPIRRSSPKAHGAIISDWFDAVIARLTNLERQERFASAKALLAYLEKPALSTLTSRHER